MVDVHYVYIRAPEGEVRKRFESELHSKKNRGRSLREDDTRERFEDRLKVFNDKTEPFLLANQLETGLLFVESGPTKHRTQERLLRALGWELSRAKEGATTSLERPSRPARANR